MRGMSNVTILGQITAVEVHTATGGSFYVMINVLEEYYIKTNTGHAEMKEYHRICIYGGAAKKARDKLKVGHIFFTNGGMLRTTETKKGRWSKVITYDFEILADPLIENLKPQVPAKAVTSIKKIKEKLFSNKDKE